MNLHRSSNHGDCPLCIFWHIVVSIKRKFYASLNSLLVWCNSVVKLFKVHLIISYCLPLITYCIGVLELNSRAISELAVCWHDAFQKIFNFNRLEPVVQLQYFCESIDLQYIYDLARFKFRLMFVGSCLTFSFFHWSCNCNFWMLMNARRAHVKCSTAIIESSLTAEHVHHIVNIISLFVTKCNKKKIIQK